LHQNHNAGEIRGAGNAFVYTEVLTYLRKEDPAGLYLKLAPTAA